MSAHVGSVPPADRAPGPAAPGGGGAVLLAALEGAPAAMWCLGPAGDVLWANARARALGLGLPAGEGRSLQERISEVLRTGRSQTVTTVPGGTAAAGPGRPVTVHVRPVPVAGGDGVVVVVEPGELGSPAEDAVGQAQLALLPPSLPLLPDVRLSGSYHQASTAGAAGGDWYDAVPLGGGRLALVVGDAVGSGVAAAGAMGRLRGALRASALRDPDPAAVLAELDAFAAQMDDVAGASVFYGVLDAATGALDYALAGHPAPLVVHADGRVESLPVSPRPPLGTVPGAAATAAHATVGEGATLVLYSDGALAATGGPPAEGLERLAAAAGRVLAEATREGAETGGLAARLVEALPGRTDGTEHEVQHGLRPDGRSGGAGHERPDDVAVLLAHRCGAPTEPLVLELPALPQSLPRVRRALGRWMSDLGMGEEDQVGLMVAVGEACANSVEHAYRGSGEGAVHVRAEVDVDGQLTVTVADDGTWRPPDRDPGDRGRGLLIMRQLVDTVHIEGAGARGGTGTTVTLRSRLRRSAEPDPEPPAPALGATVSVDRSGASPAVRVSGIVDLAAAEHLRIRLLEASHGGTVPVTLDLGSATGFGSAAVRVALGMARIAQDEGWRLAVRVPAASGIRHVLEVAGVGGLVELVGG